MGSQLGFSKTSLTGAYTLSLIVAAISAPFVGRFIDKGLGKFTFSFGTILAFSALFLLSQANHIWHFYVLWFFMGIAMSCSLYEACFAFLTKTWMLVHGAQLPLSHLQLDLLAQLPFQVLIF